MPEILKPDSVFHASDLKLLIEGEMLTTYRGYDLDEPLFSVNDVISMVAALLAMPESKED
jgi:hypothetical protein